MAPTQLITVFLPVPHHCCFFSILTKYSSKYPPVVFSLLLLIPAWYLYLLVECYSYYVNNKQGRHPDINFNKTNGDSLDQRTVIFRAEVVKHSLVLTPHHRTEAVRDNNKRENMQARIFITESLLRLSGKRCPGIYFPLGPHETYLLASNGTANQ